MNALIALAATILAQDTARAIALDTLTVNAPRAVTIVTKERIQGGRPGVTLDEALSDVAGVFANNRYNFDWGPRISSRGFGSRAQFGVRGIRLIQDGIPLTMPDGQSNLNNIDLTSTGTIEVLRGAASVLHGNAAGGVINLRSEESASGLAVEARAIAASDYTRFNGKASGGTKLRYLFSLARSDGTGFREHARFQQTNLTARLLSGGTAITISLADAPTGQNPGALPRDSVVERREMAWPRNVATDAGEHSRQLQVGVEHRQRAGSVLLEASGWGVTRTVENPLPFAFITLDRRALGVRGALGFRGLTLGVTAEGQADERAEFANNDGRPGTRQRDQTDQVAVVAPFARVTRSVGARLSVHAGARYDLIHFAVDDRFTGDGQDDSDARTMSALSPALGATWTLSPEQTVFASISTAFQTPTITEIINRPPSAGQPCCVPGFNTLGPERAVAYELGFRGRRQAWSAAASIYHMQIDNTIVPFQVAQVEGRDFFRNAGRTRHRGIEVATTLRIAPALQVTTSYTLSDFVFVDDGMDGTVNEGNQLPGVPRHHVVVRPMVRLRYAILEPEIDATSAYFADDANTVAARNAGAIIFNLRLRASRPIGRLGVLPFGAVNNVTDARYNSSVVINATGARYFEPAPGRNFYLGASVRLERNRPIR